MWYFDNIIECTKYQVVALKADKHWPQRTRFNFTNIFRQYQVKNKKNRQTNICMGQ